MKTFQLVANYSKDFLNVLLSESNFIIKCYNNLFLCLSLELRKDAERKVILLIKERARLNMGRLWKDVCEVAFHLLYLGWVCASETKFSSAAEQQLWENFLWRSPHPLSQKQVEVNREYKGKLRGFRKTNLHLCNFQGIINSLFKRP